MRHRITAPRVGIVALALVATACMTTPRAHPSLAGTWTPVSAEMGGKPLPVAALDNAVLHLSDTGYEFGGDRGTYALVGDGPPAQMDIHGVAGPNAGRTIPAIYSLSGDMLTICYQLGAGQRPSGFMTATGTQQFLVHYRRTP